MWASSSAFSKAEKDSDIEDPMAEALALCSGSFPTDRLALVFLKCIKLHSRAYFTPLFVCFLVPHQLRML